MSELENYIHHFFSISPDDCQKVAALFKPEILEKGSYLNIGQTSSFNH